MCFFRLTTEFNNIVELSNKEKDKIKEITKQNEEVTSIKIQLEEDLKLLQKNLAK